MRLSPGYGVTTLIVTLGLTLATLTKAEPKRGFLLTVPKLLSQESTVQLPLNLYNVDEDGEVTVALYTDRNKALLSEARKEIVKGQNTHIMLEVPKTSDAYWATIQINGSFSTTPPYEFSEKKTVNIRQSYQSGNKIIILVETDKPIYKPGQKVQFRVLPVDSRTLKPAPGPQTASIWIEDPNNIRVEQWLNVSFTKPIMQFESQLSEDTVLGRWTIFVKIDGIQEAQSFEVEEYVLPKFQVNIINPPYLLADAKTITWKVCAKYTYGKYVHGTVKIEASCPVYSWETGETKTYEGPIEGCYEYTIDSAELNYTSIHSTCSYRGVKLFAEVTEKGTDVKRNATTTVYRTNTPLTLSFNEEKNYFKPGLPYHGELKVKNPDNSPAAGEEIEMCSVAKKEMWTEKRWASVAGSDCKVYTSDEDGIIQYTVPPKSQDTVSVKIEARALKYEETNNKERYPNIYQPRTSTRLQSWYSPSGSHLQIEPIRKEAMCGEKLKAKLLLTTPEDGEFKIQYQLFSRGKLVAEGQKDYKYRPEDRVETNITEDNSYLTEDEVLSSSYLNGQRVTLPPYVAETDLELETSPEMSPTARLLVFYVREDGETVADSQKINFEKCLPNKVTMKFGNERQQPATPASIHIAAAPGSLCGIGVVDQSVYLQKSGQDIEERVFNQLSGQDVGRYNGPSLIRHNYCENYEEKPTPLPAKPIDVLLSGRERRAIRPPRPRPPYSSLTTQFVDALMAFEEAGLQVLTDLTLETRPCWRRFDDDYGYPGIPGIPMPIAAPHRNKIGAAGFAAADVQFQAAPEALGGALARPPAPPPAVLKSAVEVRDYFPETWLWEVEAVGDDGFLDTKRELPHAITKWIGKAVCVGNEAGLGISKTATITGYQDFFIEYTLPYSVVRGELVWLPISVFNYLEECLPVTVKLDPSEDFELVNGTAEIAMCVCNGLSETHKYLIRPKVLGQMNITVRSFSSQNSGVCSADKAVSNAVARDAATRQLLVEPEGFPEEKTESRFFCGNYKTALEVAVPEDVVEGSARAYVSVSGDLMGPALEGLDKLVRLPTGCGEQNMLLFVPNIVVLDYLTATGKLTKELEQKARENLKAGYQRQLKYKRGDNSYSAFGNSDESGSMWLTLFVIRSFKAAQTYTFIDENDIQRSAAWVASRVSSNGCVPRVGRVLHSGMKGGLGGSQDSLGPLTAYAAAALIESGYYTKNNSIKINIDELFDCMERQPPTTAYALALYAYAAALGNRPSADTYLELLKEKQTVEGNNLVYWKDEGELNSKAIQVETAAYVVRTYLLRKGKEGVTESLPIVRWISRQRNSYGGFVSTQDTVVALLALSEYSKHLSKETLAMDIKTEANDFQKTYQVNEDNKILVRTDKLPSLPTELEVETDGTGCAFIQANVKYNVMNPPQPQTFELSIVSENANANDLHCRTLRIKSCFNTVNLQKPTNMAVLEIKMLSGYTPDKEVLGQQLSRANITVKRYEVDKNFLILYFDEVTDQLSCIEFDAIKEAEVDNLQPATAKIYDYYRQEIIKKVDYVIDDKCQASSGKPSSTNTPVVVVATGA